MKLGDKLFVYGSLRSSGSRHDVIRDGVRFLSIDILSGALIYRIPNGPFPFPGLKVEEWYNQDNQVVGETYEITDEYLPSMLDRFEGYPMLYSRIVVETDMGFSAWVYTFNGDVRQEDLIETGDWINQ